MAVEVEHDKLNVAGVTDTAVGAMVLDITLTVAVPLQPVSVLVMLTVYIPGLMAAAVGVFTDPERAGPVQLYVGELPPLVVAPANKATVVLLQVRDVALVATVAVTAVVLNGTDCVSATVQLLDVFVAINV